MRPLIIGFPSIPPCPGPTGPPPRAPVPISVCVCERESARARERELEGPLSTTLPDKNPGLFILVHSLFSLQKLKNLS
jgi:hypothetical protein